MFPDSQSVFITYFAKLKEIYSPENFRLEYRRWDHSTSDHWIAVQPSPADRHGYPLGLTGYTVARQRMLDDFPWPREGTRDATVEFFHYRALISRLLPDTVYEYRITCAALNPRSKRLAWTQCAQAEFRTPPTTQTESFRFASLADLRGLDSSSPRMQREINEALQKDVARGNVDFAILPGDISNETGTAAQYYSSYFREYQSIMRETPFYAIQGNHDMFFPETGHGFLRMVDLPRNDLAEELDASYPEQGGLAGARRYYSFDWGNARFFALDVSDETDLLRKNQFGKGSTQYRWLEEALRESADRRWRIAFFHIPLENSAAKKEQKAELLALLQKYRVQLIVNGHYEYPELHPDESIPRIVLPSGGASFMPRKGAEKCPLESRHRYGYVLFEVSNSRILVTGKNRFDEKFFEATVEQDASGAPVGAKLWIDDIGCKGRP